MPDACQPGSLCSWHRRANLPHRHPIPWPMMPVRCLLTRPRALRSAGIPASPLHTPSPVSLLLLPAFLISSLSSTNCRVPTRLHPSPRRGTQESLTPPPRPDPFRPRTRTVDCLSHLRQRPSPSQPTQTQRLLRCTASTCDPLRRLIDPLRHLLTARHHQSHCYHSSGSPRCPSRKTLITLRLALVNAWGISQHHSIEPPCFNPILIQSRFLARLDTTCLVHLLHPPLELHINHVVLQTPESRSLDDAAFPGAPDAGLGYVGH